MHLRWKKNNVREKYVVILLHLLFYHNLNVLSFAYMQQHHIYLCKYMTYVLVHYTKPKKRAFKRSMWRINFLFFAFTMCSKVGEAALGHALKGWEIDY